MIITWVKAWRAKRRYIKDMNKFFKGLEVPKGGWWIWSIAILMLLQGCAAHFAIYPNDQLIKLSCDGDECGLRTNILICDDENIYCEYISVPLND